MPKSARVSSVRAAEAASEAAPGVFSGAKVLNVDLDFPGLAKQGQIPRQV